MAMPMYPSGAYAAPMRRPGIPGIAVNSAPGTSPMPVPGAPPVPAEGPAPLAPTAFSAPQGGQPPGMGQPPGGMPGATPGPSPMAAPVNRMAMARALQAKGPGGY